MKIERKIRYDAICYGNPYDVLIPIQNSGDFLHYIEYSPQNINPSIANNYFKNDINFMNGLGGCSGVFKDGKVLRQFDWTYDESAQFIVRMNADTRFGVLHNSIGMAFTTPILSRQTMQTILHYGISHPYFSILPYTLVDGINDAGIYVQSNVVPGEDLVVNINYGKQDCCIQMMLVRFLLDRLDKISNLRSVLDELHLYSTNKINGYGIHLMVADSKKSCIIEFENDHYEISTRYPLISNFRVNRGFRVHSIANEDFTPKWETVEPHGMGVERWKIMSDFLKDPNGSFYDLRQKLRYTNAYDDAVEYPWLTEISYGDRFTTEKAFDVHINGTTSQYYNDYSQAMKTMNEKYQKRSRLAKGTDRTWQTVHSCIYDIANLSGQIQIQENDINAWNFKL